jgi:hypothetical protein
MDNRDNWEKMELRKVFDGIIRERDDLKMRYLMALNEVEIFQREAFLWVKDVRKLVGCKTQEIRELLNEVMGLPSLDVSDESMSAILHITISSHTLLHHMNCSVAKIL